MTLFNKIVLALGGAVSLAIIQAPAMAQDNDAEMEAFADLGAMFEVEPLTPEQEARLPRARAIMEKVLPEGTLADVMGDSFDGILGPMMEMANNDPSAALTLALGTDASSLDLDEEATREALTIVDPAWRERGEAIQGATQAMVTNMMTRMEPMMRNVMTELYAIYFGDTQLADIETFFSTPSGTAYARQSYAMASDPRIMAAMFAEPEILFGTMTEIPVLIEEAGKNLPSARNYADLSGQEKAHLIELTGLSGEELETNMAIVAEHVSSK